MPLGMQERFGFSSPAAFAELDVRTEAAGAQRHREPGLGIVAEQLAVERGGVAVVAGWSASWRV